MRPVLRSWLQRAFGPPWVVLLMTAGFARPLPATAAPAPQARATSSAARQTTEIANDTWVDHDGHPIRRPRDWEPEYMGTLFRRGFVDPVTHAFDIPDKVIPKREAVNVNAYDEVPNSSWFTNRNHVRSVPVAEMRHGPDPVFLPRKPWTITKAKQGGVTLGFQIKDADGKKWLIKLDPRGYPQLGSGADMVSRTLIHAAGYNVPHNEPVRFRRDDLTIHPDVMRGPEGKRFGEGDLDSLLAHGALFPDGSYSALASLFVPGHVLGAPSMSRLRPGDSNDWYSHRNRRELRGLYVLCSWINDWDTKDQQFLDVFVATRDTLGHVQHYLLDVGSSLGAAGEGPKEAWVGYESGFDLAWTARRFVTLGFVQEPWRRTHQETGIPSVGNIESEVYRPEHFKPLVTLPAFQAMTDRDGYWGAKIVASFSDAQIAAAVEAAHYEDPRASDVLMRHLIVRRDKIARYWFGRVAPLDFFTVRAGALRFHDLAVDVGLERARAYEVEVASTGGRQVGRSRVHLGAAELPLAGVGNSASQLSLAISVAGSRARPARVELTRKDSQWIVTRVRHG